jgi:hypothetical protein
MEKLVSAERTFLEKEKKLMIEKAKEKETREIRENELNRRLESLKSDEIAVPKAVKPKAQTKKLILWDCFNSKKVNKNFYDVTSTFEQVFNRNGINLKNEKHINFVICYSPVLKKYCRADVENTIMFSSSLLQESTKNINDELYVFYTHIKGVIRGKENSIVKDLVVPVVVDGFIVPVFVCLEHKTSHSKTVSLVVKSIKSYQNTPSFAFGLFMENGKDVTNKDVSTFNKRSVFYLKRKVVLS